MITVDLSNEPRTPDEAIARVRANHARRLKWYSAGFCRPEKPPAPTPTVDPADDAIRAMIARYRLICDTTKEPRETLQRIATRIAKKHGLTFDQLAGVARQPKLVIARHEYFYEARRLRPDQSLPAIGRAINKDHTTALHGIRRHAERNGLPALPGGMGGAK